MRLTLVLVAVLSLAPACSSKRQSADPTAPPTLRGASFLTVRGDGWPLVWHDEFDGTAIDTRKWKIGLPWKGSDGEGRHHDDRYLSYTVDHNIIVENGVLKLLTRREDVKDRRGRTFRYTQGLITTAHAFRHRYGYWEARVKIPVDAGPGLWPAFWTLAEGWPPEMDICEVWTSTNRNHQGMAYRIPGEKKERWDHTTSHAPLPRGWTTFGMEWGPGYQIYNMNGRVTKRVYGDHVTDDAHYILLNSGVESRDPPTDKTIFPNAFEVDYVRVFGRPDAVAMHNGDFEGDDGYRPWERQGNVSRSGADAHRGTYALSVNGPASAEQKVYNLKPNTPYLVRGWVKAVTGDATLGVGDSIARAQPSGKYRELRAEFATGPEQTTATIRCAVPDAGGAALFDDVTITARPDSARRGN